MKLRKLSVGLRLGASFGAILLITALIAATGMWRIASLQGASERVATQEIEQRLLVEDWAADIRLNWVRTEAFLKAIDRDYMDKLTADTQATAQGMEAKVQRVEALVQGEQERALLSAIAAARTAYAGKLAEILELHRGGEPNVPALVDKDLRPLADQYLKADMPVGTRVYEGPAAPQSSMSWNHETDQTLYGNAFQQTPGGKEQVYLPRNAFGTQEEAAKRLGLPWDDALNRPATLPVTGR